VIRLGKYALLRKLATGGFTETWLARGGDRFVALRRLLPYFEPEASLWLDELKLFTRFAQRNVARLYEVGADHLAIELVHGEDLSRLARMVYKRQRKVPVAIAVHIAAELCRGLAYLQAQTFGDGRPLNLVHAAIKPDNVRISFDGAVKLLDLGVNRLRGLLSNRHDALPMPKVFYLAPEHVMGQPLDARTDVFCVGLVLYELLTGKRPFAADTALESLKAVLHGNLNPPSEVADVPLALSERVMRALAKERGDRYGDAGAFLVALEAEPSATQDQLAALMTELFPEQDLLLRRFTTSAEPLALFFRDGRVTLDIEGTGARFFLTRGDTLSMEPDGRVEISGPNFGTQPIGRVEADPAAADFLELAGAASGCRVVRPPR
jgi:serine/threonine protein kinase